MRFNDLFRNILIYSGIICAAIIANSIIVFLLIPNALFLVIPKNIHNIFPSALLITMLTFTSLKAFGIKTIGMPIKFYTPEVQMDLAELKKTENEILLIEKMANFIPAVFRTEHGLIKIKGPAGFLVCKYACKEKNRTESDVKTVPSDTPDIFMEYTVTETTIFTINNIKKKMKMNKTVDDTDLKTYNQMIKENHAVLIPLNNGSKNCGYLLLGNKSYMDSYTAAELDALTVLKSHIEQSLCHINNLALINTQKVSLENEMQRASRMESIGIMAGGIAHDFNNLLTSVIGNISLAKEMLNPEEEILEILNESEKSSRDAKSLTNQLLNFSKGGAPFKKITSISKLLVDTVRFSLRGSNIKYRFAIAEDLWFAEVAEGQLVQVINNIVLNSEQAMPNGGLLNIEAQNVTLGSLDILTGLKGNYIKITIQDHGCGIPKENLFRIFEPYFTTKPGGSGLGLTTANSIIKKHNGHINVDSKTGAGTTFHVYLPASKNGNTTDIQDEPKEFRGKGKIMVLDDDPRVRKIAGRILNSFGYQSVFAINSSEAVKVYKKVIQSGESFDAIVMDLTIPGETGAKTTIQQLRELDPNIKAIVSSGYSNHPVLANPQKYGFKEAIIKPYTAREMGKVLSKVLNN